MYNFKYVSKKEAAPAKNELIEIINGFRKHCEIKISLSNFNSLGAAVAI